MHRQGHCIGQIILDGSQLNMRLIMQQFMDIIKTYGSYFPLDPSTGFKTEPFCRCMLSKVTTYIDI